MSYEVQLWTIGNTRYRIREHTEHASLEEACEFFVGYASVGAQSYNGTIYTDYQVLLIHDGKSLIELHDSERLFIDHPDGIAAALLVHGRVRYRFVQVYSGESDDPVVFARSLSVCLEPSDASIRNAETILRRRSALGIFTEFDGDDAAIWKCMRLGIQFPSFCGNVISDWEPVATSDPSVNLVNFV